MAGLNAQTKIGSANRFFVKASPGDWDLGSWAKAEGLDVTWEMPDYRAGDAGNARWFFPANTKYSPVKLTRAATKDDTQSVKDFLSKNSFTHEREGWVTIELRDSSDQAVMIWELRAAKPKKWNITSFDAGASQVAVEVLEFDHEGFLDDERTG
ncbi:phage tail protein [Actinophytocola xanthii]|uniref:Phage tail protein n=1 Tax=Actinophytocola xanthii TaxID=1912961 RepID=A0A1Q8CNZ7_9PSEU|nr:phage tail protein [Actinophytocola xanthii]OLF16058.1 hypothetical protein BU204_18650 [Actinophytocola xanthii]